MASALADNLFKPAEVIRSILISENRYPLENVKTVTADVDFAGMCYSVDLANYSSLFPPTAYAKITFLLNDEAVQGRPPVYYTVDVHQPNESFMVGIVNLDKAGAGSARVDSGRSAMFLLEVQV